MFAVSIVSDAIKFGTLSIETSLVIVHCTRMHSSRMRTVRPCIDHSARIWGLVGWEVNDLSFLGDGGGLVQGGWWFCPGGGGPVGGGGGGAALSHDAFGVAPKVEQTDACENITFTHFTTGQ